MRSRSSPELARCRPLLGTYVRVRARGASLRVRERAIDAAFERVLRVHVLMSAHDPQSELGRLNRTAHLHPVAVSLETFEVLQLALAVAEASGGLFDVAVGTELARRGWLPRPDGSNEHAAEPPRERPRAGRCLRLLPGRRVSFTRPMVLDLGGIAKGYAVDLAVRALRVAGMRSGVVDAGGDLRVFGPRPETVHVRDPRNPRRLLPLALLRDAAIATSAGYFDSASSGRPMSPLVDPHTGCRHRLRSSVTVAAPSCAVADALTKVVALGGASSLPVLAAFRATGAVQSARGQIQLLEASRAA